MIYPLRAALLAFLTLCVPEIATTQPNVWNHSELGELMLRPFKNAPYPHATRENGFATKSETYDFESHYNDSTVGVFIPAGYRPSDTVDFVIHFHGHKNNVANVLGQFDLCREFRDAGVNAILLVPQGPKDAADSGGGKLENDPGALNALLNEVMQYLVAEKKIRSTKLGHLVVTAHSGGYKVAGAVLKIGGVTDHITDVLLFDATYGQLENFADYCAADPSRRLISIFTEHLAGENFELISLLMKRKVAFHAVMENELTDEMVKPRGPLLVHTTELAHNDVVSKRDYFAKWVGTSDLPKAK